MVLPLDGVLCLDFEASSLDPGSYPIEVAVANCVTGERRAWLIRPTDAWLADGVWSEQSAAVHNIPMSELMDKGLPVAAVAPELGQHCAGKRVLCDGGGFDRYWLSVLYDAVGVEPPFALEDFHAFAWDLALRSGRRPDIALANSELEAQLRFPVTHRAGDDARSLAEVLRLIAGWP